VTPGPQEADGLDDLLDRLESLTARLLDPAAPLDRLVADYEEANRLLEAAQTRLEAAAQAVERG
jgi:exodeoxyribonuclease VII small subunit